MTEQMHVLKADCVGGRYVKEWDNHIKYCDTMDEAQQFDAVEAVAFVQKYHTDSPLVLVPIKRGPVWIEV